MWGRVGRKMRCSDEDLSSFVRASFGHPLPVTDEEDVEDGQDEAGNDDDPPDVERIAWKLLLGISVVGQVNVDRVDT